MQNQNQSLRYILKRELGSYLLTEVTVQKQAIAGLHSPY